MPACKCMCVPRMPVECQEQPFVQHDSNATVTMRLFSVSILYLLNPGVALYSELLVCNSSHDDGKYYMSILENCGLPKPQTLNCLCGGNNMKCKLNIISQSLQKVLDILDLQCCNHCRRLLSDFSSKFQSCVTIIHYRKCSKLCINN